jgi:hypothetical protein
MEKSVDRHRSESSRSEAVTQLYDAVNEFNRTIPGWVLSHFTYSAINP